MKPSTKAAARKFRKYRKAVLGDGYIKPVNSEQKKARASIKRKLSKAKRKLVALNQLEASNPVTTSKATTRAYGMQQRKDKRASKAISVAIEK